MGIYFFFRYDAYENMLIKTYEYDNIVCASSSTQMTGFSYSNAFIIYISVDGYSIATIVMGVLNKNDFGRFGLGQVRANSSVSSGWQAIVLSKNNTDKYLARFIVIYNKSL